jgi:GntR family transcriptional regulator, transcriptional repressor for pyruvate dehydrogenase complex
MRLRQEPRAAEAIAERLRVQIIGELSDGDHIGSAEGLAKRFEVSLPTIRQAMRALEFEGLVLVRPGNSGGFFASTPSVRVVSRSASALLRRQGAHVADLLGCVELIGPQAAARAAANPDESARQRFASYVDEVWTNEADMTLDTVFEITVEVARLLAELCDSPSLALFESVLIDLVVDLQPAVAPVISPELLTAYTQQLRDGHKLLASAIRKGNASKARRAQASLNVYFMGQSALFSEQ